MRNRDRTDETIKLLESPAVTEEMRRQWNAAGEPDDEMLLIGQNIRASLSAGIHTRDVFSIRALRSWRRYGVAASIVLAVAIGVGAGLLTRQTDNYIYHSGNQDKVMVTLDDGTVVTLGARSRIVYPGEFKGRERRVEMEGQAYFDVAPDREHPFVVETRNLDVTALGTAFEVFENEEQSFTEVMLAEGKVRVDFPAGKAAESRTLQPGQKLSHSTDAGTVRLSYENAERYSAWKDVDGLAFVRERVSNILPRLEKWFGCTIECASPEIMDEIFTFRVRTESPEVIFDNMDRTLKICHSFDPESNTYTIIPREKPDPRIKNNIN